MDNSEDNKKAIAFAELERGVHAALETYSNVHRGSRHNSMVTTHLFEQARDIILEYLGLNKAKYTVVFCTPRRTAAMFAMAGTMKLTQPKEKLKKQLPWVTDFSTGTVRFIGLAELLGAIGLIVPWLTGIAPILTPVSAIGICLIMVLATNMVHLKKREYKGVAFNIVLFLFAAFVSYGRF